MTESHLPELELRAVIGFAGNVKGSFILHHDDNHILYALGSTVVIKHLLKNEQHFLHCGTSQTSVSCMKLSKDGKLLATGQKTHTAFPASVWIWDLEQRKVLHKLNLYKTNIQDISFSASNEYIVTLGGEDDNKLVIWDLRTGDAICGSPAANDTALCVSFCNMDDYTLITAGKYNFRIWKFDKPNRKIRPTNVKLGSLKRVFNCITISPDDEVVYAGTQSGDLLRISVPHTLYQLKGPPKKPLPQGIQTVVLTNDCKFLIVGTGNGTIALLNRQTLKMVRSIKINGGITSLALNKAGDHFFASTDKSTVYLVAVADFDFELRNSAHYSRINAVCFPPNYSELFITGGTNDIRVWNARNCNELLRINVPNLECSCLTLTADGSCIISGWSDGKVRAFYPESGKLMYTIHDCHSKGVTALAVSSDGKHLVTGGKDVLVRIWAIEKDHQKMLASLREHQNTIAHLVINADDTQFISASNDGSCVLWDLRKYSRINAFFATTQFSTVLYHPDQSQLLTTGTDRMISYWDSTDLSTIRVVEASDTGAVNTMAINSDGSFFVSGGDDRTVKFWHYDQGCVYATGLGHSGAITQVVIAPDNETCVSVGDEGAIMIWNLPATGDIQIQIQQESENHNHNNGIHV